MISILPLEDWLEQLNYSETVAPFLDPTAFRDYMYSGKGDYIKSIIRAALPLKQAILQAQQDVLSGKVKS